MGRPRKGTKKGAKRGDNAKYVYMVCDNDSMELPRLVSGSATEVAEYLGMKTKNIFLHFYRGAEMTGIGDERNRYKLYRFNKEEMENEG